MNILQIIKQRKSIRQFSKKPVEKEKINKILEYANLAPSAGNLNARFIKVVANETDKKKIETAACNQEFVSRAPIVLIFCADYSLNCWKYGARGQFYAIQDATIACAYAQLVAEELGLSSCWVGAFNKFEVEEGRWFEPIALLPIGYKGGD